MTEVKRIPDNYARVNPYLIVDDAREAIQFYKEVLGAKTRGKYLPAPGGKLGHAELQLGDSVLMIADNDPTMGTKTPKQLGGCPMTLCVYVNDVDAVYSQAIRRGAREIDPVADQFYGDRSGTFEDPWGYRWSPMTHIEDVSPEEMANRAGKMMQASPT